MVKQKKGKFCLFQERKKRKSNHNSDSVKSSLSFSLYFSFSLFFSPDISSLRLVSDLSRFTCVLLVQLFSRSYITFFFLYYFVSSLLAHSHGQANEKSAEAEAKACDDRSPA